MEYIQQKLLSTVDWNNLEQDSAIVARQQKDTDLSLPLKHRVLPPCPLKTGSKLQALDWVLSAHIWTLLHNYGLPASRLSLSLVSLLFKF